MLLICIELVKQLLDDSLESAVANFDVRLCEMRCTTKADKQSLFCYRPNWLLKMQIITFD